MPLRRSAQTDSRNTFSRRGMLAHTSSRRETRPSHYTFLLAILALISISAVVGIVRSHTPSSVASISSRMHSAMVRQNGSVDRATFLAKLNAEHRREVAGMIQFISEEIRSVNPAVKNADELARLIVVESRLANIDPLYVAAVIKAESTFKLRATSNQGAHGLMQLLPSTARYISEKAELDWMGAALLSDPGYNVRLGIAYLKYLEESFNGHREHSLIAYNWGPANLQSALKKSRPVLSAARKYALSILNTHARWSEEYRTRLAQYRYMKLDHLVG